MAQNNNPLAPALAAGGALLLFISMLLSWFTLDTTVPGAKIPSFDVARADSGTLLLSAVAGAERIVALGRFRGVIVGKADVLAGLGAIAFIYVVVNIIKK